MLLTAIPNVLPENKGVSWYYGGVSEGCLTAGRRPASRLFALSLGADHAEVFKACSLDGDGYR